MTIQLTGSTTLTEAQLHELNGPPSTGRADSDTGELLAMMRGGAVADTSNILPMRYRTADLATMDNQAIADKVRGILELGKGPLLYGSPGSGKTWACAAAFNHVKHQAKRPVYWKPSRWFEEVRAGFDTGDRTADIADADLILVDDLGKERMSSWVSEHTFRLFDAWYDAGALLLISTNMDLFALEQHLGKPVFDRLAEMMVSVPYSAAKSRRRR